MGLRRSTLAKGLQHDERLIQQGRLLHLMGHGQTLEAALQDLKGRPG